MFGIAEIDHQPDPLAVTVRDRGQIRVPAALPDDPVHALAADLPEADLPGVGRVGQIVDGHAGPIRPPTPKGLVVGEQQPIGHLGLVAMPTLGSPPLSDHLGSIGA